MMAQVTAPSARSGRQQRQTDERGFLLVEALVAVAILALVASSIVWVSIDALERADRQMSESAAWAALEGLALEFSRLGAASPRLSGLTEIAGYDLQLTALPKGDAAQLGNYLLEAKPRRTGRPPLRLAFFSADPAGLK